MIGVLCSQQSMVSDMAVHRDAKRTLQPFPDCVTPEFTDPSNTQ
jgi:hypothetical protein